MRKVFISVGMRGRSDNAVALEEIEEKYKFIEDRDLLKLKEDLAELVKEIAEKDE